MRCVQEDSRDKILMASFFPFVASQSDDFLPEVLKVKKIVARSTKVKILTDCRQKLLHVFNCFCQYNIFITIYLFRNDFYRSHVMIFSINTFSDMCCLQNNVYKAKIRLNNKRMGFINI